MERTAATCALLGLVLAGCPANEPPPVPRIDASALPTTAVLDVGFSGRLSAPGFPAAGFSVMDGELPPGLFLEPTGVVGGVPAFLGGFDFVVLAQGGGLPPLGARLRIEVGPGDRKSVV